VDLAGKGKYPEVIRKYERRPDIVLHSPTSPQIIMIELTVPYESRLDEQHTFKMEKYYDLVTALRRDGITARIIAVEVGARGLVAASVYDLLKQIGLKGQARTRSMKRLGEAAERASCWLWNNRNGQWNTGQ
jgi:hypothetical protein